MQLRALMLCAAALLLMACNGGDDGTVGRVVAATLRLVALH